LYRDSEGDTYDSSNLYLFNGKSWALGNVSLNPGFVDMVGDEGKIWLIEDNDWHLTSGSHPTVRTGGEPRFESFTKEIDSY
jgi:hypothetical protein